MSQSQKLIYQQLQNQKSLMSKRPKSITEIRILSKTCLNVYLYISDQFTMFTLSVLHRDKCRRRFINSKTN